jgi:N-methylhydantoinase A
VRAGRRERATAAQAGVDTGGTFTDVVVLGARGERTVRKVPSTPAAPERAVIAGLTGSGATAVRHGSTVATNALLERKGARVVFVTTAGFEDAIEIGRQDRPDLYALLPRRSEPLVPAARRVGVHERVGPGGVVWQPLADAEIRRVVRRVRALRPEAVAVGLLHAWANPAHERRLGRALAALGVPVTLSSALCPEIREVERFATTVANAFLLPRVRGYLRAVARAHRATWAIVLSHGGTAPLQRAAEEPVRQLLSGPAAGLRAALESARACGYTRALSLDVGGTSTDVALLGGADSGADGLPRRRARDVAGVPVLLPSLDVQTVGAGGGSVARVDSGGTLNVGPESASADPGPAAYGRGGPATVTDALLVLGRIAVGAFADGSVALDVAAAERAMAGLARALRLRSPRAAAEGVRRVAESHMEAALRRVSVERGEDPRGGALVAFGGGGGLHACDLAVALGMRAVVWPRHAGVLCALGALHGGERRERSRSVLLDAGDGAALRAAFRALEREVLAEFPPAARRGLVVERWAEARIAGQAHELPVPLDAAAGGVAERFHRLHERRYGFTDRARAVQVVTLEVRAGARWRALPPERRRVAPAAARRTRVWLAGAWRWVPWLEREALPAGAAGRGPAVISDPGATLWAPAGWRWRVTRQRAVLLERGGRG